jgi:hypothetical protein
VKPVLSAAEEVPFYLEDAQQVGGRFFLEEKVRSSNPIRPDGAATCLREHKRWGMMSDKVTGKLERVKIGIISR